MLGYFYENQLLVLEHLQLFGFWREQTVSYYQITSSELHVHVLGSFSNLPLNSPSHCAQLFVNIVDVYNSSYIFSYVGREKRNAERFVRDVTSVPVSEDQILFLERGMACLDYFNCILDIMIKRIMNPWYEKHLIAFAMGTHKRLAQGPRLKAGSLSIVNVLDAEIIALILSNV